MATRVSMSCFRQIAMVAHFVTLKADYVSTFRGCGRRTQAGFRPGGADQALPSLRVVVFARVKQKGVK